MSEIDGVANGQWREYGSVGITAVGNVKGRPEGGRKLQIDSFTLNSGERTVPAPISEQLTLGLFAELGMIGPSGFGARASISYAVPASDLKVTTDDAEAEQAGAQPGDMATAIPRESVIDVKLQATYTADLKPWFSATAGLGGVMSSISYCLPPSKSHAVGLGGTEDPNYSSACYDSNTETHLGLSALAEGAFKLWENTALVAGVSFLYYPTKGSALAGTLGFQIFQ